VPLQRDARRSQRVHVGCEHLAGIRLVVRVPADVVVAKIVDKHVHEVRLGSLRQRQKQ
jgi:hypothetical protein